MSAASRAFFSHLIRDREGRVKRRLFYRPNLRTTAGLDWQAAVMGSGAQPAAMRYIALSPDSTAPAVGDTSLTSEFAAGGLPRALATYAHTAGVSSFTESFTFTATATNTVNKTALFNASAGGTMGFESAEPSPPTLVNGDTDTQTTTINL